MVVNQLKVHPFQSFGFNRQPAPLLHHGPLADFGRCNVSGLYRIGLQSGHALPYLEIKGGMARVTLGDLNIKDVAFSVNIYTAYNGQAEVTGYIRGSMEATAGRAGGAMGNAWETGLVQPQLGVSGSASVDVTLAFELRQGKQQITVGTTLGFEVDNVMSLSLTGTAPITGGCNSDYKFSGDLVLYVFDKDKPLRAGVSATKSCYPFDKRLLFKVPAWKFSTSFSNVPVLNDAFTIVDAMVDARGHQKALGDDLDQYDWDFVIGGKVYFGKVEHVHTGAQPAVTGKGDGLTYAANASFSYIGKTQEIKVKDVTLTAHVLINLAPSAADPEQDSDLAADVEEGKTHKGEEGEGVRGHATLSGKASFSYDVDVDGDDTGRRSTSAAGTAVLNATKLGGVLDVLLAGNMEVTEDTAVGTTIHVSFEGISKLHAMAPEGVDPEVHSNETAYLLEQQGYASDGNSSSGSGSLLGEGRRAPGVLVPLGGPQRGDIASRILRTGNGAEGFNHQFQCAPGETKLTLLTGCVPDAVAEVRGVVQACKLDPGMKAPPTRFQSLIMSKRITTTVLSI